MLVLAHIVSAGSLPLPRWLLAYLLGFAVVLLTAWLRAASPRARWSALPPRAASRARFRRGAVVGAAAYVATIGIGLLATPESGYLATLLLVVVLWIGGLTAALFVGDWYRALNPFALVARLLRSEDDDDELDDGAPAWTAAAMLLGFLWFWLVYGERSPTDFDTALFLSVYGVAAVGGIAVFGPGWAERGEGFAATFGLVGSLAPVGRNPVSGRLGLRSPVRGALERGPVAGDALLGAVLLGGVGYEGLLLTSWWTDDVVAGRTGTALLLVSSVGLLWTCLVAHLGISLAAWGAERLAAEDGAGIADRLGAVAAALALGGWVAYELPQLMIDAQNIYALASDPLAKGWDLLGTADHLPDPALVSPRILAWLGLIALAYGVAAASVATHEACFAALPRARAARAVWAPAAVLTIAAAGAGLLLLGH